MKTHLEDLKRAISDGHAQLVDIREQHEWDAGHVRDATFIPLSHLASGAKPRGLDAQKTIYVYCRSGNRVKQAGPILEGHGYKVIQVFEGFDELVREGFEPA